MRDILRYVLLLVFCAHANSQETNNNFFFYKEKKVDFNFVNAKANSNSFNVILFKSASSEEIEKRIKSCTKDSKHIGPIYYLVIPEQFSEEKEELVLEFLSDVFSKRKLIDKEMNIIADGNYLTLYRQKIEQTRRYKCGVLNRIEKSSIVKTEDNWCDVLE